MSKLSGNADMSSVANELFSIGSYLQRIVNPFSPKTAMAKEFP